jgi:plasmid stability protein
MQLSIRGCPDVVHQALRQKARQNRRSLNKEALTWLEKEAQSQKPVTGRELAERMRKARKLMTEAEHKAFAEDIEKAVQLMRREHLH